MELIKEERLINRNLVKTLLEIENDVSNDSIDLCIGIAITWVQNELKGFPVPDDLKKTAALLYACSLFRNATFETSTEQSSFLAKSIRIEAQNLIKLFKREFGTYLIKVNNK